MNILIVEDEQDIRELLEIHLSKEGYEIFTAEDGMQALDIFQNKDIDIALTLKSGEYSARVEINSINEIGKLSDAINLMAEKIQ
ncbi:MAG: response regulator [Clostridium sp.]